MNCASCTHYYSVREMGLNIQVNGRYLCKECVDKQQEAKVDEVAKSAIRSHNHLAVPEVLKKEKRKP